MRKKTQRTLSFGVIGLAILAVAGCSSEESTEEATVPVQQVRVIAAKTGTLDTSRVASVTLAPERQIMAVVGGQVGGRVERIYKREGETVTAGEVVVQIDETTARLQVQQAQTQLQSARVQLAQAERQVQGAIDQAQIGFEAARTGLAIQEQSYAQGEKLLEAGGISPLELQGMKAQLDQARLAVQQAQDGLARAQRADTEQIAVIRLQVQAAQSAVELAQSNLDETTVEAPFGGTITELFTEEGQMVGSGTQIFALADIDPLLAVFRLPPEDAARLPVGSLVDIRYGGRTFQTPIIRNAGAPSVRDRLVQLTAALENSNIPAGSVAQVAYGLDLAQGTLIPSGAVQILEGKSYVYVVGGSEQETKAERKEVAVLAETGGTMAISGIEKGTQIIYPVPTTLRPDTTIKVIETATNSEPPSAQETE